jgi:adenylate cyclase
MKYKTKLICLFVGLAVTSDVTLALILFTKAHNFIFQHIQSKVLSIVTTAALDAIDTDMHEKIHDERDQTSPEYLRLVSKLRKYRDANRRTDMYVKYIWTMRPDSTDPKVLRYVLDCEENPAFHANPGRIYIPENEDDKFPLDHPFVQSSFHTDEWGTFLSASAPLHDAEGKITGVIGIDVEASYIRDELHSILYVSGLALIGSIIAAALLALWLANLASKPLHTLRATMEEVAQGNFSAETKIHSKDEFGEVATAFNKMIIGLQQRENLKGALARYVSEEVTETILATGKSSELKSERKKITILFADMRGFTSLSESISPEEMVQLLNVYFEKMIDAIFRHNGYLNKFMGDGLMAVFGATRDDPYQEKNAIEAALDMRKALEELRAVWRQERRTSQVQDLRIGIGINTGVAIVGNIGSKQKMEFGCIGDSVNLASRLEAASKDFAGVDFLVSEYTYVAVRSDYRFKACGEITVKGKAEAVKVYTVLDPLNS